MSFSSSVKEGMVALPVKNPCCRRALLFGMMLSAETRGEEIAFSDELPPVADLASDILSSVFGVETHRETVTRVGRVRHTVLFENQKIRDFLDRINSGEKQTEKLLPVRCPSCRQSFLRGAFLSLGTVSDPRSSFHAEFRMPDVARAEILDAFLAELGVPARKVVRGGKVGLYYKSEAALEELFGEMGDTRTVFELINVKIELDIRNNENRATNCVTKNIAKTVEASQRQIASIRWLSERGLLDKLPEDLQATAKLRLENEDISLAELAALHEPPISKSGLSHRLGKIVSYADQWK